MEVNTLSLSQDLKSIEELPSNFHSIFSPYPCFNLVQSKVFYDVFYTDNSVVVSAPTGSGKTAIFELAIVRLLNLYQTAFTAEDFKIVYISPIKALCQERVIDWHQKFSNFGLNCISVTGDTDNTDLQSLLHHNLIVSTPEKWDSLTRKWRDNKKLVQLVKLFMIDEVHLLNEECRGATLEVIVSRMKTVEKAIDSSSSSKIRFIAMSATVANIDDVAAWIGPKSSTKSYKFPESVRPVPLKKIVLGYPYNPQNSTPFKFDITLSYKLPNLLLQYSAGRPTLIFCSTRKSVEMTARHIVQSLTINLNQNQKQKLVVTVQNLSDLKLKQALISGVGYHHAGLIPETRHMVEELFRNNDLPVLVTTSTLALGVNLPAHLVIIKSTKCYSDRGFEDYSETALLQMVGRAGRPQFDVSAVALILTTNNDKSKFEKMIGGTQPIESNLHRNLIEHLNAEVVLRTITDLGVALEWLTSTYLYIRARKNPRFYGLPLGLTSEQIDKKLLEMCQIEINKLVKAGMMTINQNIVISPMQTGVIMARYCVAFDTMKLFQTIQGSEILQQILALISKCDEFKNDRLRVDDKRCLNLLNKNSTKQTIRFPLSGKIKTIDMKVNCIIQAILGCLDINNPSILADSHKILRHAERITHGLIEYLQTKSNNFSALLNTLILSKCFQAKLWENSPYVSKQLVGIGSVMSSYLVNAGKTSFATILESNPRELELIIKKRSLTGDRIIEQVQYLPKYEMSTKVVGESKLELRISLVNIEDLMVKSTVNRSSIMTLLVGDNLNRVLLHEKYMHSYMIENQEITKCIVLIPQGLEEVYVHFISADWVGFDCESKHLFTPEETPQFNNSKTVQEKPNPRLTQMFMDVYMKIKKNTPGKQRVVVQKKPEIEEQVNNIESISEKLDVTQSEQNEVLIDLTSKESNSIVSSLAEKYCSKSESLGQKIEFQSCRIKPNRIQVKPRVGKTVEDKIHHAMEFELNLYPQNTKPDLLNSTPKRKLSDDTSESIPETITECCLVKKRKPDEIPIEKLPKLVDLPGPSQSTTTELKPSFFGKLRPSQRGTKFQLCDEDSPENPTNIESLLDICSESFLETLGLLPPSKSQAANIPSVGDYYSQLVTRAKEKEEAKTCIVDSPTKEDELPIRFELPQSESLNSARYSPDIELDSFTVSPDENRDLVQVPYNFVHPQPNYVMQEPPHSSMGSYYNGFPNHFLHFNQSMVPPYDGSGAFGGYPGFQAYPGVYNSMYPFVVPPRSVLVPEEERYNNSVDKENVFVMRNFMRSLSGDDDDNYY